MAFAEPTWGVVDPAVFRRIVVVSPHFDDAAMGAGHLLAELPRHDGDHRPRRRTSGLPRGALGVGCPGRVQSGRRRGGGPPARGPGRTRGARVGPSLAGVPRPPVPGPGRSTDPRGGGARPGRRHRRDRPHRGLRAHGPGQPGSRDGPRSVTAGARPSRLERAWFCYEDHGYKHIPGLLAWRVAKLLRAQPWPTPAIVPHVPDEERKRRAIFCYTSQIPPLENEHALTARLEGHVPEQFWQLAPPPEGWEGLAESPLTAAAPPTCGPRFPRFRAEELRRRGLPTSGAASRISRKEATR